MQLSTEIWKFIREHQNDDVRLLALQAKKYPGIDIPVAIVQIAGRQAAKNKIPLWYATEGIVYPVHLSLEQCSSEITAKYKAVVLCGGGRCKSLADLTGGLGIDCAFLSAGFEQVTYIEQQETLCDMAENNFSVLGLNHIAVKNCDSVEYLHSMIPVDCIFIDPARRNEHGGKTIQVSDCEPDVEKLEDVMLTKARRVMIKLSPMLDLSLALRSLPHTKEVHIISVQNECKELLLVLENEVVKQVPIHCINLTSKGTQTFSFTREKESLAQCVYTDTVKAYLYEPNASVLKAGAFKSIAEAFRVEKLHPNSHLYTSDRFIADFPGRKFDVVTTSFQTKDVLNGARQANIAVRNYPLSAAGLRKRLKVADGGDLYLFATTVMPDRKIIIGCRKVDTPEITT